MVLSLFVNEENETNVRYNLIVTCRKLSRDQNVDMFITNLLNLNLIVSNFNLRIWILFSLNFFYLYYVLCWYITANEFRLKHTIVVMKRKVMLRL